MKGMYKWDFAFIMIVIMSYANYRTIMKHTKNGQIITNAKKMPGEKEGKQTKSD